MNIAAVLLAAGRSTRFGPADKITAPLDGKPLGLHAAQALLALRPDAGFLVAGDTALSCPGFIRIANPHPDAGLSHSLALGVAAARQAGADAVVIALADMPLVPAAHLERLVARWREGESIVASFDGVRAMPPALFGSAWFAALESLTGDQGARALLDGAALVALPRDAALDVDRSEDLDLAARSLQRRHRSA